jgi:O-methyltransferase involved in polyketide biosynthesis
MKELFEGNAVYFTMYFIFMAGLGQYVFWKKVSTFFSNVSTAFSRAKKVVAKQQAASRKQAAIDVQAVELVPQVELQYKVNRKEAEKQLKLIRERRAIDAGMHNLTSKYHKAKV